MLTFRQKIFFGYVGAFLLFALIMYPFATRTVQKIALRAMKNRTDELIVKLQRSSDLPALKRTLYSEKYNLFFRASIVNDQMVLIAETPKALAESHKRLGALMDSPEVVEAFKEGVGYRVRESGLYEGRPFVYLAKRFIFLKEPYVLRVAFPQEYIVELTHDFEVGATALAALMLLLFSLITWFIINHITRPIQEIIAAVRPYQEGNPILPEIELQTKNPSDEFYKLADTLNSLSAKVQDHIDSLTFEKNEKKAVLESLVEGVVAVDEQMQITYMNQTAERFLGSASLANHPKCHMLLKQCLQEGRVLVDSIASKQNQQKLLLDLVACPIKDQKGAILVLQDKTSHYKLLEMRKDFIANASHELKTPITIIQGFAETLHDNRDFSPEMVESITEKIMRNCTKMTHLIKDLLALTDVENLPESRLVECDLSPLIESSCNDVRKMFPDAEITVHQTQESFPLIGDPPLLETAFTNLIENAAKYSEGPAQVVVALSQKEGWITVSVTDEGLGIPPEALEQIFHRFYRLESTRQKVSGSGLGLSIVEMIVEKHFGKITVTSEVGKGSCFTVYLPIEGENYAR